MKTKCFLILIFLMSSITFADEFSTCEKNNPNWFECKINQDCSIIFNPCGHPIVAANKKFAKNAQTCNIRAGAALSCVSWKETEQNKYEPICKLNVCVGVKKN